MIKKNKDEIIRIIKYLFSAGSSFILDNVLFNIFIFFIGPGVISIYIWARFELPFAIGAGLSLTHDIILALGMLAFTGLEFNLTTLASLLTLAGYSINDTVVIYDRIRTCLKTYRNKPLKEIINIAIDSTFTRTVLTSLTTAFAVLAIFIFGGEVLRGFSAVMLFGIIVGTYSSMLLSTSTLLLFSKKLKR